MFFLVVLAGCRGPGVLLPDGTHEFAIEGKLAIRAPDGNHAARFRWRQDGERYAIELWGPLGQGRTLLEGDGRRLRIRNAGGKLLDHGPVRTVMLRQLGWYLPLEALPQWVEGGPIRSEPVFEPEIDAAGRMTGFSQLGWRLAYTYAPDAPAPRRITAETAGYRVLMVVQAPPANGG
ncbi:MAG: outer membrane lipoprotein LolB [Pseudomonadales bacterium]